MKIILGTGLSGLVGSRIVELFEDKYSFINLDLTAGVDITDYSQVEQKISSSDSDTLIHLAAFTDVSRAWEQRNDGKDSLCYKVNVAGSRNISQACQKYNKYLIHFSTDFVFDGKKENPYIENDKPNPIEWYGQTKLWAEEEVNKSGCQNVILRIAFPFKQKSSDPSLEPAPKLDLVRNIKDKLDKGEQLQMFSDQIITPTYIDDIVKAIEYCIVNKPKGVYHCVGSSPISPYDLALLVAENWNLSKSSIAKSTIKDANQPGLRPRQKNMTLSNKKLQEDFGITMMSLQKALKDFNKK